MIAFMPAHKLKTLADRKNFRKSVFGRGCRVAVKKIFIFGIVLNLLVPYGFTEDLWGEFFQAKASSRTLSTSVDWQAGEYNLVESNSSFDNLRLTADGTWEPRVIEAPEWGLGSPGTYVSDGQYVYVLRGSGDNEFYRYLPQNDEWRNLTPAPYSVSGGNMIYVNGNIYVLFGANQDVFYKYTISTDSWTRLNNLPELVSSAHMATDGEYIYATRGNTELYKYSIATNIWSAMKPFTYANNYGGLIYHNGYLFHLYNTSGSITTWYRYRISDGVMTRMANVPGTMTEYNPNWTIKGNYLYLTRNGSTRNFYRYDLEGNTWTTLEDTPIRVSNGGVVYNASDDLIYVFRGSGTTDIWRYDIDSNSFLGASDLVVNGSTVTVGRGGDSFYYQGKIYTIRGVNTRNLYVYDIASGVWSQLADSPSGNQTFNQYTHGVLANGEIYMMGGSAATTQFQKYTISSNTWTTLTVTPATVSDGALAYPGSGDFIYSVRGSGTATTWRYSISGNSWDDAAVADLQSEVYAGSGTAFVSDGTDLYLVPGLGVSNFQKYTIATNTWSTLSRLPFAPMSGSDMVYDGHGKFIAIPGNYDKELFEYTITSDSWRRLTDMPTMGSAGWGTHEGGSVKSDGNGGIYIIRGGSTQYVLKYSQSSDNYVDAGIWTSGVIDLGYVTAWSSLDTVESTPGDSMVTYSTRTSSDKLVWSSWQLTSGDSIQSPVARYIQVKVGINSTTDNTDTPIVESIAINYAGDTIAPSNPTNLTAKSTEVAGVNLVSGQTYSFTSPYFSWTGASDSDTEVAGYYVYFGNSSSANPVDSGTWQTTSNYTVTEPLSAGSYYLLIKTKDTSGNVSSSLNAFNYIYSGIPAEKTSTASLTTEFATGSATNINVDGDEIKLAGKSNGIWLQDRLSISPVGISYGARTMAYIASTNKLYTFQGNNSTNFYEYDFGSDTWTQLAGSGGSVYMGGGVIEGPEGFLFALRGNNTAGFMRYSIVNNTWEDMADAPNTIHYGSSMIYDGSRYIYVTRGNADDTFWSYDTTTDTWATLDNTDYGAPDQASNNLVYDGGDLTYDGNDTIYSIQGYSQPSFSSYSITNDQWTVLTDLPTIAGSGSSIYFDQDSNAVYYTSGVGTPDFFKFDINTQTWIALSDAPAGISYGSDIRNIGGSLMVTAGGNSQLVWKYDIATDYWQIPTSGLFGKNFYGSSYDMPSYGGSIIRGDGDYLYLTKGNYSNNFVRYNKVTGEIINLSPLPSGSMFGQNIEYNSVNNKIYFVSSYWQKLFVYDIATNTWSEDDNPPALPNQYGSTLTFDGSRYLYWTRGGGSSFYRYDYLANSGSRWSTMANIPYAGNSASLVYKDGYIYATRGDATLSFYRYDVAANTWSDPLVADLPSTTYRAYYGAALADGRDGYLYFVKGENSYHFLRYSIANNTWEVMPRLPANVTSGGGMVNGGDGRLYLLAGNGTATFGDGVYTYVIPSTTASFEESGEFISGAHFVGDVYKWSNLRLTYSSANDSSISVYTRSSADAETWSSWVSANSLKILNNTTYEYKISSPVNPYIQIKIGLTSLRGIGSGVVSDYTINYIQDTTAPENPSDEGLKVYSTATNSAQIQSNNWYPYPAIDITWPEEGSESGATDTATGSGVLGYYAAMFATDSGNPVVESYFQEENNMVTSGLVSGETYYFALTTKDEAGNVNENIWRPFVYKFDNRAPTQPDDLSADPSGYSAVDRFSFSWGIATDSASGIAGYCYKTGASTGDFATERCTTELTITDVPSYKKGANTFYLRAKDNAGNFSPTSTVSYYFNDDSPSPPKSLSVSPETSATNSFEFSWSAPEVYYGNISNLRYFYSVNALPSIANVQETALTHLIPGPYATLPGENTFYVVAKDEAGNIDFKQYATATFYANTPAPGMPENMDIADVSVKATKAWKIAITWQQPSEGGDNVASYQIWRSSDAGATFTKVASTAGISYVDTGLSQLTYQYKVKACDSANNCGAFGSIVEQYPDGKFILPADLVDEPMASNVTTKKATISWTTNRTSDSKIAYGTEPGKYIDTEVGNSDQAISHVLTITNLAPGTTYYYVAKWTDEDGNLGISDENSFSTSPAPSAKEVKATSVGLDKATINFTSSGAEKVSVLYGKSTSFGGTAELAISPTEATYGVYLEGLEDGTKYYYRVDLFDVDGAVYPGDIYSFETLPRPKVTNVKLQQVKGAATSTMLITWSSNTEVSSIVTYYPSASPSMVKDSVDIKMTKAHKMIIKGLIANAPYTLIVKGRDKGGNEAISESQIFTTASDTRPPQISNMNTEMSIQGTGEEARAQLIVSWETDELASSQVVYGEGSTGALANKTQVDSAPVYTHLVVIQNLVPSKVYRLKAVSADLGANVAESIDTVVITPKATQSALNLVVGNLSQAFGFLGGLAGGQ